MLPFPQQSPPCIMLILRKSESQLTDTDNRVVRARGEGGWGEVEQGREGTWRWKVTWLGGVNTQYSTQMMDYRILHLKPVIILLTSVTPINTIKKTKWISLLALLSFFYLQWFTHLFSLYRTCICQSRPFSTAIPHHLYPLVCWWAFGLLLCLGYCKQRCSEHRGT